MRELGWQGKEKFGDLIGNSYHVKSNSAPTPKAGLH